MNPRLIKYTLITFVILQFIFRASPKHANDTAYLIGYIIAQFLVSIPLAYLLTLLRKKNP
ncbi:MAG: hypothetical protein ACRCXZ_06565 [Patescibacteria group bacterium]